MRGSPVRRCGMTFPVLERTASAFTLRTDGILRSAQMSPCKRRDAGQ